MRLVDHRHISLLLVGSYTPQEGCAVEDRSFEAPEVTLELADFVLGLKQHHRDLKCIFLGLKAQMGLLGALEGRSLKALRKFDQLKVAVSFWLLVEVVVEPHQSRRRVAAIK